MAQFTCELCGCTEFAKDNGQFVCQSCGCKYNVEDLKKQLDNVSSTESSPIQNLKNAGNVTASQRLDGLYDLARNAWNAADYSSSKKYYDMILADDPSSWEAIFYSVLLEIRTTYNMYNISNLSRLNAAMDLVFSNIQKHATDKQNAINLVTCECRKYAELVKKYYYDANEKAFETRNDYDREYGRQKMAESSDAYSDALRECDALLKKCNAQLINCFSDTHSVSNSDILSLKKSLGSHPLESILQEDAETKRICALIEKQEPGYFEGLLNSELKNPELFLQSSQDHLKKSTAILCTFIILGIISLCSAFILSGFLKYLLFILPVILLFLGFRKWMSTKRSLKLDQLVVANLNKKYRPALEKVKANAARM